MTAERDEAAREEARRPAPFTQSQVEELARGTLSKEAVAAVLGAFPRQPGRKSKRSKKQSPIPVSEDELRRLADDAVTPADLRKRLQAAAGKAPPFAKPGREAGERPTKEPPQPRRPKTSS